jgi:hypothetical protein
VCNLLKEVPGGGHSDFTNINWRNQHHQRGHNQADNGQRAESHREKLLLPDKNYKLTREQSENWIRYAVVKNFPARMPWEGLDKKKQKQDKSNARLAYVLHVHQPDHKQMKTFLVYGKDKNIWHKIWGNSTRGNL